MRRRHRSLFSALCGVCGGLFGAALSSGAQPPDARAADPIAEAVRRLSDPDIQVRNQGYVALQNLGPRAMESAPALLGLLGDASREARGLAIALLGRLGPPVVPELCARLVDPNLTIRLGAAQSLGEMGAPAADAEAALAAAVAVPDQDPQVVAAALRALGWIGSRRESAVRAILPFLAHSAAQVRWAAAGAIERSQQNGRGAWPALVAALTDTDFTVRFAAACALVETGSSDAAAVPVLMEALRLSPSDTRAETPSALLDLDTGRYPSKAYLRRSAAQALGRFGPTAAPAVADLVTLLEDSQPEVRLAAVAALGRIGPAAIAPMLEFMRRKNDMETLSLIAGVFDGIGPDAMASILPLLQDANPSVRLGAVILLGGYGGAAASALPALERAAADPDPQVAEMARRALAHIREN